MSGEARDALRRVVNRCIAEGAPVVVEVRDDRPEGSVVIEAHVIYIEDEAGRDTDQVCAFVHPASQDSVNFVLAQPTGGSDGRSEWLWVRLQDGTLVLGVFPQGDTYETVEGDAEFPTPTKGT